MFLFTNILCVKCNVLYSWGPSVQAQRHLFRQETHLLTFMLQIFDADVLRTNGPYRQPS